MTTDLMPDEELGVSESTSGRLSGGWGWGYPFMMY